MSIRIHLFGGGIDELRDVFGNTAPNYIQVDRLKNSATIVTTSPDTYPIIERLIFKRTSGGLVENLYLLDEVEQ